MSDNFPYNKTKNSLPDFDSTQTVNGITSRLRVHNLPEGLFCEIDLTGTASALSTTSFDISTLRYKVKANNQINPIVSDSSTPTFLGVVTIGTSKTVVVRVADTISLTHHICFWN